MPLKRIDLSEVEVVWCLTTRRARSTRAWPAGPSSASMPKIQGPPGSGRDLGAYGGKAQRLGADAEVSDRLGQIEPRLDAIFGRTVHRDLVVRTQRGYAFTRPAVAVARRQLVSVQQNGDQIIIRDKDQLPDGVNDVGCGTVALATASAWQTQFRMDAAHPVDEEYGLPGIGIDISDHLLDHGADDALLEPGVGRRGRPDRAQIVGQGRKRWR